MFLLFLTSPGLFSGNAVLQQMRFLMRWSWYSYHLVCLYCGSHWFIYVKPTLHFWDKAYLIVFFEYSSILLASICIENCYIYDYKTIYFVILFYIWVYRWFRDLGNYDCITWIRQFFCFYFEEYFWIIGFNFHRNW